MSVVGPATPFLEVLIHDQDLDPTLCGLSVGYELGEWRAAQFAEYLLNSLPEWALSPRELEKLSPATMVPFLRRAAALVYDTDKYGRRGEWGELILHVVLRQIYGTLPAISKVFFKDSANDTVKGFDAVHVVARDEQLELWLGEAKFYLDLRSALRDAIDSIQTHSQTDYLRGEFTTILNKIDDEWPHAERLRQLLDPATSLDTVFNVACLPVLVTYDSPAVLGASARDDAYVAAFVAEIREAHRKFVELCPTIPMRVHLVCVPTGTKAKLSEELDRRLRAAQEI